MTPSPLWGAIFPSASYYDVNAFVGVTRALQIAISHQVTRQTFADETPAGPPRPRTTARK